MDTIFPKLNWSKNELLLAINMAKLKRLQYNEDIAEYIANLFNKNKDDVLNAIVAIGCGTNDFKENNHEVELYYQYEEIYKYEEIA